MKIQTLCVEGKNKIKFKTIFSTQNFHNITIFTIK